MNPIALVSKKFSLPINFQLVGGIPTPLKNMTSSVGMIIPFPTVSGKSSIKPCSKPPDIYTVYLCISHSLHPRSTNQSPTSHQRFPKINGRSPGSNRRSYVSTIFLAIFWGISPEIKPLLIGLIYGRSQPAKPPVNPPLPRLRPMASISSMKMMEGAWGNKQDRYGNGEWQPGEFTNKIQTGIHWLSIDDDRWSCNIDCWVN